MLVQPAPGLKVRDPRTRLFIPVEGIEVEPGDIRFARLLRDGDLTVAQPKAAAPEPAPAKAAAPAPEQPAKPAPPADAPAQAAAQTKSEGA